MNLQKFFLSLVITTLIFTTGYTSEQDFKTLPEGSILETLSLQSYDDKQWAASSKLYPHTQNPVRWSPYVWAWNAAALTSISSDKARLDLTVKTLLTELSEHSIQDENGKYLVVFRYNYPFEKYSITPPWYSAFGNAAAAIGLMHIRHVTNNHSMNSMIEGYLDPIPARFSYKNEQGSIWYAEYISEGVPNGHINVINGHFFAVGAMYEWKQITGTQRYDKNISQGMDTMQKELPNFIKEGYFSYAEGFDDIKDYGQQRAVNYARVSCELREAICPTAIQYQALFETWNK